MKKFVTSGIIFLIIISFSACISQEKEPPTKKKVLEAIENIDKYSYEENIFSKSNYSTLICQINAGIDKKRGLFVREHHIKHHRQNYPRKENITEEMYIWEFFDGEKAYIKITTLKNGEVVGNRTDIWELGMLKLMMRKVLPKNTSKEKVREFIIKTNDLLTIVIKPLLENATIENITQEGAFYVFEFTFHKEEFFKVDNITYEDLKRVENVEGKLWIKDNIPVKLQSHHVIKLVDLYTNTTKVSRKNYNITFTYKFELPRW